MTELPSKDDVNIIETIESHMSIEISEEQLRLLILEHCKKLGFSHRANVEFDMLYGEVSASVSETLSRSA